MRKFIGGTVLSASLILVGAGAAMAAVRGSDMDVSTSGSFVNNGHYDFKYSGCQWGPNAWDGYVSGTFVVTVPNDHLNATVDGYGYVKLKQGNDPGNYPYSSCIIGREVLIHDTIKIQVCREHWYGDDCSSVSRARN